MTFVEKCNALKSYFAIAVVGLLEAYALSIGIDGALFTAVIAIISGLGGYEYAKRST